MKKTSHHNFFLKCLIFLILLLLTCGCKEKIERPKVASSIPNIHQLEKSKFTKFVDTLNALPESERYNLLQGFLINNPISPIVEENGIVSFYWIGNAASVLITGDMQKAWSQPDTMNLINCNGNKLFYKTYSLPLDARIDYLFIVDDSTITDPKNPTTTPSGFGLHSQCAMPLFKINAISQFRPDIEHGTIDTIFFKSSITSMPPRMLKIYKPAGYENLAGLPTLYVNDGFKAIEYCNYINVLNNLIADKKISPVVVVFIDYIEGDQDYFLNITDEYFSAVCNELIPLVDKNYKTSQNPQNRVLTGISAGAHISLLTPFKRPDKFLNAAGQSATITKELLDAAKESAANKTSNKSFRFYFDVGRYDLISGAIDNLSFLYSNQLLDCEMRKKGINYEFKVVNDGHQWASWRERIDKILLFFFETDIVK